MPQDTTMYIPRWVVNTLAVLLAVLTVVANIIKTQVPNGVWLGLNEVQWHWALIICAVIVALNAAFNHVVIPHVPTAKRLAIVDHLHRERMRMEHDPQLNHL